MPLAQAHRYNADTRDDGFAAAHARCSPASAGPWRCHYAGECSRVCPKGVDPAKAIQLMKRELVLDYFHLRKQKCPAKVATQAEGPQAARGHPRGAEADRVDRPPARWL